MPMSTRRIGTRLLKRSGAAIAGVYEEGSGRAWHAQVAHISAMDRYPRPVEDQKAPLPKVTPSLLSASSTMCPRRLHAEYTGAQGSGDPVGRARLREAFLDAARLAHADGGRPKTDAFSVPASLEVEEQRVFAQAASWYSQLFGARPVTTHLHVCDSPTELRKRGMRLGGWVDLTVIGDDGLKELRQLKLSDGRPPAAADPIELESVWVAVLRLAGWVGDGDLLVSWSDLVRGDHRERLVRLPDELPELAARLDDGLAAVNARADGTDAVPGRDCGSCRHVWHCPAHPGGINVSARRGGLAPGIVTLTPTSFELLTRCARAWRDQFLLAIPPSDETGSPDHGQRVHDLLRFVHDQGSCHDDAAVEAVLDGHGGGDRLRDEIARHARRCPSPSETLGHEVDVARFHGKPWPPFMATARIDAIWVHGGWLDARDYKTGASWYSRVADDPRALIQAWVLAPVAAARDLRLRVRYEHLAAEVDEDPESWEPDTEELAAVEERLRAAVQSVHETDIAGAWRGVADESVCKHCRYRSICPDSAAAGEPRWPVVDDLDDEPAVAGALIEPRV